MSEVLGVDLGRTIVDPNKNPYPDCFRLLKRLVNERFGENVYIVSKVNAEQKVRAIAWLLRHDFYAETDISPNHVEFCAERHEKAPICRRHGVTHMIDDRPEVMSHLSFVPHRLLFQPIMEDVLLFKKDLTGVHILQSWQEIERLLCR